jgi:Zn-dependent protease with chaperone function
MALTARYSNGVTAAMRDVVLALDKSVAQPELIIADHLTYDEIDRWPVDKVFSLPTHQSELRVGVEGRPPGARLVFTGAEPVAVAQTLFPELPRHRQREAGKQLRILGFSTLALVSVLAAYVFGVPLIANRITAVVPPAWETNLGRVAEGQIQQFIGAEGGFAICDRDPTSLANRAISRFTAEVMEGSNSPFIPRIDVVRSEIPNAFALPGGRAYYFSALLAMTETADEFAGVMAHEIGHVIHRHGMEGLIASSATGLLVGFVLGDMTNVSVAGAVGATLIDSRFSREAEREADRFAAETALRLGFDPAALAGLLERVAGDDQMSQSLAFLSTHPLTVERRAALEEMAKEHAATPHTPVFSVAEWQAIKSMCDGVAPNQRPGITNTPSFRIESMPKH